VESQTVTSSIQLSVVIPAHNESENLKWLVPTTIGVLRQGGISYELVVVDDHSTDNTLHLLRELSERLPGIRIIQQNGEKGFGRTLYEGFQKARGEVVVPFMGDASDDPVDILKLYHKIEEGYDVVYGSRFTEGGSIRDYPFLKLVANRLGNGLVRWLFRIQEKDITNAFKAFRRETLLRFFPIEANAFNITLELAIKAHLAGCRYTSVPVHWEGRTSGVSHFRLRDLTRYYRDYLSTLLTMWGQARKKGEAIKR